MAEGMLYAGTTLEEALGKPVAQCNVVSTLQAQDPAPSQTIQPSLTPGL